MRRIPAVAGAVALGLVLPLATAASADQTVVESAGSATSSAALATIQAVGHTVVVGDLSAVAGTINPADASVRFTPLILDGASVVDPVVATPSSGTKSVGGETTPGLLGIVSATSPSATIRAALEQAGPVASVLSGLGGASVLGLPIGIDGTLDVSSTVTDTASTAGKALTISDLSLPTLTDLLAALGLDIAKLPLPVLDDLLADLPLDLTDTQAAIDAVNSTIDTAEASVATLDTALDTATAQVAAAQAVVTTAQAAFDAALAGAGLTSAQWALLSPADQLLLFPSVDALDTALAAATAAVATAQSNVGVAQAALDAAIATLTGLVGQLGDIVSGILDGMPLLALDSATVATQAVVSNAKNADVTGTISGLRVLDLDVLDAVTGDSTLDLAGAAQSVLDTVQGSVQGVLDDVAGILEGATGITMPIPQVKVLEKATSTGADGAFGLADATVSVLSISIPSIELPTALALDSIIGGALPPGVSAITGGFASSPLSVEVGSLTESARFKPASVTSTPVDGAPELPNTGGSVALAIFALAITAGGVVTFRRMQAARI